MPRILGKFCARTFETINRIMPSAVGRGNQGFTIDKSSKVAFLNLLSKPVFFEKQTLPLMMASHYLLADFKRAYADRSAKLEFPRWTALELRILEDWTACGA